MPPTHLPMTHGDRQMSAPTSSSNQGQPGSINSTGVEGSSVPAGGAVKFLASQIPTFGATEDDDIELWIEKIESVAQIHNLSPVVMLSAAAVKLTKATRRWFDLSPGDINRSWLCFRAAILDRFKKKNSL
ncbi:retrotransposon gag protein [Lasius niger]|uniref:Retrotransposon gag protein n=1 Tax=Lasius niger TaxID=67767 RepID=A0A0J7KBD1_LASNI|nr:retrotransposon gag protein [Lasius niger]